MQVQEKKLILQVIGGYSLAKVSSYLNVQFL